MLNLRGSTTKPAIERKRGRDHGLDGFRGLAILLMLFAGKKSPWSQFRHAAWDSLTIADIVYRSYCLPKFPASHRWDLPSRLGNVSKFTSHPNTHHSWNEFVSGVYSCKSLS